jgi:hypothetical protein
MRGRGNKEPFAGFLSGRMSDGSCMGYKRHYFSITIMGFALKM